MENRTYFETGENLRMMLELLFCVCVCVDGKGKAER